MRERTRPWRRSWLNVRSDQKYNSAQSCEEETPLNAARHRKVAKAAKRTVARAKPKRTAVKKAARKQPVTPVVETVAVEVIEQPAPGVITVTEIEETRQLN